MGKILILMGSDSDFPIMKKAIDSAHNDSPEYAGDLRYRHE